MRRWVVRCVLYVGLDDAMLALVDQLVRLGMAKVHRVSDTSTLVDLLPPDTGPLGHGDSRTAWAQEQAARLEAEGVSAVAAPAWVEA